MNKKNILYAEEDKYVRELISKYFKRFLPELNLEIFEEGNSLEKRLQKGLEEINLVVTDGNMQEVIRKYARLPEFERIPFILYSGSGLDIGEQAVRDGAFAYLDKSRGFNELIPIIKKALKIE